MKLLHEGQGLEVKCKVFLSMHFEPGGYYRDHDSISWSKVAHLEKLELAIIIKKMTVARGVKSKYYWRVFFYNLQLQYVTLQLECKDSFFY